MAAPESSALVSVLPEKAALARGSFERAATPAALAPPAACRSAPLWAQELDAADQESAPQPTVMPDLAAEKKGPKTAPVAGAAEPGTDQRMWSVAEQEHSRKEPAWCGPASAAAEGTTGLTGAATR